MGNMVKVGDALVARIIYEDLSGEVRTDENELVVICSMPDDGGCWCEDSDGDEKFFKLGQIYYDEDLNDQIKESLKRFN